MNIHMAFFIDCLLHVHRNGTTPNTSTTTVKFTIDIERFLIRVFDASLMMAISLNKALVLPLLIVLTSLFIATLLRSDRSK